MFIANGFNYTGPVVGIWDSDKGIYKDKIKIPLSSDPCKIQNLIPCITNISDEYLCILTKQPSFLFIYDIHKAFHHSYKFKLKKEPSLLKISPDSIYLIINYTNDFEIYNLISGKLLGYVDFHYQDITCLKFMPDLSYLITASKDAMINVWLFQKLISLNCDSSIIEPLLSWNDHSLAITDLFVPANLPGWKSRIYSVSLDHTLKIYDIGLGSLLCSINFPTALTKLCSNCLNNIIFVGDINGGIYKIDMGTSQSIEEREPLINGHKHKIVDLLIETQNFNLISACEHGLINIWDIYTLFCLKTIDTKVFLKGFIYMQSSYDVSDGLNGYNDQTKIVDLKSNSQLLNQVRRDCFSKKSKKQKTSFYSISPSNLTTFNVASTANTKQQDDEDVLQSTKLPELGTSAPLRHTIYINPSFNNNTLKPKNVSDPNHHDTLPKNLCVVALCPQLKSRYPVDVPNNRKMPRSKKGSTDLHNHINDLMEENTKLKEQNKNLFTLAMGNVIKELPPKI